MEQMTIGQLAAAAGVNVETVRYYQRRGLLATPEREVGSIGRYSQAALTRLRFIKRSQSLGFSLADVHALLSLDDGQRCSTARSIENTSWPKYGNESRPCRAWRWPCRRWSANARLPSARSVALSLTHCCAPKSGPASRKAWCAARGAVYGAGER